MYLEKGYDKIMVRKCKASQDLDLPDVKTVEEESLLYFTLLYFTLLYFIISVWGLDKERESLHEGVNVHSTCISTESFVLLDGVDLLSIVGNIRSMVSRCRFACVVRVSWWARGLDFVFPTRDRHVKRDTRGW